MSTKKKSPKKAEPTVAPAGKTPERDDADGAKPPESAENFEHVLRRIISERDRLAQGA